MARGVVESVVDQLAAELSRSVVVNDPAVRMIYASPHYGDADRVRVDAVLNHGAQPRVRGYVLAQGVSTWTRAGVIPANDALHMHARVCFPVRWHGELLGLVMVMDADRSITTAELGRVDEVVAELAFALHSEAVSTSYPTAVRAGDEDAVPHLVGPDATARARTAAALRADGRAEHFDTVTAVDIAVTGPAATTAAHIEIALRHALAVEPQHDRADLLSCVTGRGATLLLGSPAGAHPTSGAIEQRVTAILHRAHDLAAERFRCVAGIGDPGAGLEHAARSWAHARLARQAAELGLRGQVASWDALDAYGPVLALPADVLTDVMVPHQLRRVLEVDADGQLAATLRAYLDAAGNGPAAAARLHVHRTTLYYRLARLHDLVGLDANDGATRLACHLGFVMLDVIAARARC